MYLLDLTPGPSPAGRGEPFGLEMGGRHCSSYDYFPATAFFCGMAEIKARNALFTSSDD
jgi:hypothetical protein